MRTTSTNNLRRELQANLIELYDPREANQIAALIIEHIYEIPTSDQLIEKELIITGEYEHQTNRILQRLLDNEPIQYVLGYTEFYGRRFKTDSRALIPRPETEELVDFAIKEAILPQSNVLDIGTGTGCIAITLALETNCTVFALDIEKAALALAKVNAATLGAKVAFIRADFLISEPELPPLDIIISNPPYVPEGDRASMHKRVKGFEPHQALYAPDQDPLVFHKRIATQAPKYLRPGGQVFLEIYHLSGPAVKNLFQPPVWSQALLKKDLQGKNRIVKAILSPLKIKS